ncbi:MAG: hypothetical protein ACKOTE_16115 [Opitutaceae bacterium]
MDQKGVQRRDQVLQVVREGSRHHPEVLDAVLQGDLVGEPRAREDAVDQLRDALQALDLGVGDRPVIRSRPEGHEQARVGTALWDRHGGADPMGPENRGEVIVGRGGAAALQALGRDPTEAQQGVESVAVSRDPYTAGGEMPALQGQKRGVLGAIVTGEDGLAGETEVLGVGGALGGGDDLAPEAGEGPFMVEPEKRTGAVIKPDRAQTADDRADHPRRRLGHRQLQQPAEQPGGKDQAAEHDPAVGDMGENLPGIKNPVMRQRPGHEQIADDDNEDAGAIQGAEAGEVAEPM